MILFAIGTILFLYALFIGDRVRKQEEKGERKV